MDKAIVFDIQFLTGIFNSRSHAGDSADIPGVRARLDEISESAKDIYTALCNV